MALAEEMAPLLSVMLNLNMYVPATSPETVVVSFVGVETVAFDGPETWLQAMAVMVPSGSFAEPMSVVEFKGKVRLMLLPAVTVGGWLGTGMAFTLMVTVAEAMAPLLSVTVNL